MAWSMTSEMREAKDTFCTTCGAAYPASARFCGVDGTVLRYDAASTATKLSASAPISKVCPACRRTFPGYARFCPTDASMLLDQGNFVERGGTTATGTQIGIRQQAGDTWFGQSMEAAQDEVIGKIFANKYKIESLLGEGGMARVYKATHLEIEKPVVIKLMHSHLPQKGTAIKRFEVEIKVTARLNHPNLVSVFDGGVLNGNPYLVMEYISGESLREYIGNRGQLSFNQAITIASQICSGLQEAHNEGVVHRDLKPENIMLRVQADRPDWVKVVDFGIAHLKQGGSKLTATGVAVGTVDYMSPEYLSDKPIDHRADIYALGVMLFELLTGNCPFESEHPEAVLAKHLWTTPTPPSNFRADMVAGCALDRIVEKALEKEPEDRFQSTSEMRLALQEAISNPGGA